MDGQHQELQVCFADKNAVVVFCAQTDLQSVAPHIMSSLICVKWLVLCYPLEKMQQLRFAICVVGQLDLVFLVVSRCMYSLVFC